MYWPLKIYARGLLAHRAGYPDACWILVGGYVALLVARLAFDEAAVGSVVSSLRGPRARLRSRQIARALRSISTRRKRATLTRSCSSPPCRPLLFLTLWGRKRRCCVTAAPPRLLHHAHAVRHRHADPVLALGVCPPPVLTTWTVFSIKCVASDGAANLFLPMNLFQRFQLSRRPSVTWQCCRRVARRTGTAKFPSRRAAVTGCGTTRELVCFDAFLRDRRATACEPVAIYRTNRQAVVFIGSWHIRAGGIACLSNRLTLAEVRRILENSGTRFWLRTKRVQRNMRSATH